MKWEYKGRRLANPLVILWRLFWFPIFKLSAALTCLIALIVWGPYTAKQIWEETK